MTVHTPRNSRDRRTKATASPAAETMKRAAARQAEEKRAKEERGAKVEQAERERAAKVNPNAGTPHRENEETDE